MLFLLDMNIKALFRKPVFKFCELKKNLIVQLMYIRMYKVKWITIYIL